MPLTCEVRENGDLLVTCDGDEREDLRDGAIARRGYWSVLWTLFEDYACNGSYTPFDAGDGNPFVGLTSAPCIAEAMTTEDDGENVIEGRCWWFPDYMTRDPLDELAETGRTVFKLAPEEG